MIKRNNLVRIIVAVLLCAALIIAAVACSGHEGTTEEIDTVNHLKDDMWKNDTGYMRYADKNYTSVPGIDVSEWNGDIDWEKVKAAGIKFAIIRLGYRGYESGRLVLDMNFYDYIEGALAAGLEVGVYFFSQAVDEEEAREEAKFVLKNISGYNVTLPIYFDTEEVESGEARTDDLVTAHYTAHAAAFCDAIRAAGYEAGVYASQRWINKSLDIERLECYNIWFAKYADAPNTPYRFDMWQYTESGSVDGIETAVDLNVRVFENTK